MYRELEYRYTTLKSEPRLREFDEACKRYKAERGTAPADAQALVDLGWVKGPAIDAFGDPIGFKGDCIAVTRRIKMREKELEDFIRRQLEREGLQEL